MSSEATVEKPRVKQRLGQRVIAGSAIGLVGFGAAQVLRLISNTILSRLLFPEAFGLMAIIRLLSNGLELISSVGLQPAIVRHERGDDPLFLDTGFSIQVMRGALLWALGILAAVPIARFYEEPELAVLIPVATAASMLTGLESLKLVGLRRHLQLGRLVSIELWSQGLTLLITVVLAWIYRSVWVLVSSALLSNAILLVLSHTAIPGRRDRLRWDPSAAREIFSFGKWIFVSTLLTFFALRMDVMMLGRLVSMEELGIYSIAITVVAIPRLLSARIISTVLLPALAESHRESHERLARNFDRVRRVAVPGGLVALLTTVAIAPAFFIYLYDPRYHDAGWISQASVGALWFGFLQDSSARALVALGDARSFAFSNAARTVATAIACALGYLSGGVLGLIVGTAVGAFAGYLVIAFRLRQEGMPILWVDMRYSAFALALGVAIGVGAPAVSAELQIGEALEPALTAALGMLLVIPLASFALLRIRREIRERGGSTATAPATSDVES